MVITIREATSADHPAIHALLRANGLPVAGFEESVGAAVVACDGTTVVGAAALELYAGGALLRSVVVDPSKRGLGVGQRVTRAAIAAARARHVSDVYLLTTTAERFFPKLGFRGVDRASIPASVRQSVEFKGACPASAVALRLSL